MNINFLNLKYCVNHSKLPIPTLSEVPVLSVHRCLLELPDIDPKLTSRMSKLMSRNDFYKRSHLLISSTRPMTCITLFSMHRLQTLLCYASYLLLFFIFLTLSGHPSLFAFAEIAASSFVTHSNTAQMKSTISPQNHPYSTSLVGQDPTQPSGHVSSHHHLSPRPSPGSLTKAPTSQNP